jgi:hypothetical protein
LWQPCNAFGRIEGQEFGIVSAWSNSGNDATAVVTTTCNGGATPVYQFIVQANAVSFTENGGDPGDTVVASQPALGQDFRP